MNELKKILILLSLLLVVTSVSMAAPKATATAPAYTASDSAPIQMAITARGNSFASLGYIAGNIISSPVLIGSPTLRIGLNKDQAMEFGLNYSSLGTGTSLMGFMGRFEMVMAKLGETKAYWAGQASYYSVTNAGATTSIIGIMGFLGAEYMFSRNLSIIAEVMPAAFVSASSGGASVSQFYILTNTTANLYSGLRLYF